jgi:hypothetical protein
MERSRVPKKAFQNQLWESQGEMEEQEQLYLSEGLTLIYVQEEEGGHVYQDGQLQTLHYLLMYVAGIFTVMVKNQSRGFDDVQVFSSLITKMVAFGTHPLYPVTVLLLTPVVAFLIAWPLSWLGGYPSGRREYLEGP